MGGTAKKPRAAMTATVAMTPTKTSRSLRSQRVRTGGVSEIMRARGLVGCHCRSKCHCHETIRPRQKNMAAERPCRGAAMRLRRSSAQSEVGGEHDEHAK